MQLTPVAAAAEIMGSGFHDVQTVLRHLGEDTTGLQSGYVPLAAGMLEECASSHLLIDIPPYSLTEIWSARDGRFRPEGTAHRSLDLNSRPIPGWKLIRKAAVPASVGRGLEDQRAALKLAGELPPTATEMWLALLIHRLETGERLFASTSNRLETGERLFASTSVRTSDIVVVDHVEYSVFVGFSEEVENQALIDALRAPGDPEGTERYARALRDQGLSEEEVRQRLDAEARDLAERIADMEARDVPYISYTDVFAIPGLGIAGVVHPQAA